tara:strand:- start:362 stop:625 length:264 start_codon:yes stop_codon:yes gene_type:complete
VQLIAQQVEMVDQEAEEVVALALLQEDLVTLPQQLQRKEQMVVSVEIHRQTMQVVAEVVQQLQEGQLPQQLQVMEEQEQQVVFQLHQ